MISPRKAIAAHLHDWDNLPSQAQSKILKVLEEANAVGDPPESAYDKLSGWQRVTIIGILRKHRAWHIKND